MNKEKYDYYFKILTLGETEVGKTSIILRYTENTFNPNQLYTVGIDCKVKKISYEINDSKSKIIKTIKLLIWDTAGQERFKNITSQYFHDSNGILLIFDITNRSSFIKINYWIHQIKEQCNINGISILLVGNKIDIQDKREVTENEAKLCAKNYGVNYIETSAMTGVGIDECFHLMIKGIIKNNKGVEGTGGNGLIVNNEDGGGGNRITNNSCDC